MEVIFKTFITLFTIIVAIRFNSWLWKSHVDVKDTFTKIFKREIEKPKELITVRDENSIYQNGLIVGKIGGKVTEDNGKIIFEELYDTNLLNSDSPLEYKRTKCKIIVIGDTIGIKQDITDGRVVQKIGVLRDVICQKLSD